MFELEVFLVAGSSRVALESVDDLRDSSTRLAFWGFDSEGLGGAGASESLFEELESEEDDGRALFAGLLSSESLDDDESLEEEELGVVYFWAFLGAGAAAALVFFAGGAWIFLSDDESDSESESEVEDSLELAFRFNLLIGSLTVAFALGSLAPGFSFSPSASLSELVLDVEKVEEIDL